MPRTQRRVRRSGAGRTGQAGRAGLAGSAALALAAGVTAAVTLPLGGSGAPETVRINADTVAANPCSFSSSAALKVINERKNITFRPPPSQNIYTAASGLQVRAGNGRLICLQPNMLNGLHSLGGRFTDLIVTSMADGRHSARSNHYIGRAVDFGTVNGQFISDDVPGDGNDTPTAKERALLDACRATGADEIIGPGQPGHDNHIHCAWNQ